MVESQVCDASRGFPLVVTPARDAARSCDALRGFIDDSKQWIEEQLVRHGAILLRGFAVADEHAFETVCRSIAGELGSYGGGNSPRTRLTRHVYTSTEYPRELPISLHNELSYAPNPPRRLFFHCQLPAASGGATPLADCRAFLRELAPEIRERFSRRGVRYVQNLHGGVGLGRSWQATFETESRAEVEARLAQEEAEFVWKPDGALRTTRRRPATARHPVTGEEVWFNQAEQWHPSSLDRKTRRALAALLQPEDYPHDASFGDGSPFDDAELAAIRTALRAAAVSFPWQAGDVLVLDNHLVAHGRDPYTGERSIRVAMA
jgi:alpha-ketoglutarate-dependent taurine dioxygenase